MIKVFTSILGDTLARQLTQFDSPGISPEELQKKTVADITKQNLDIIFIGINPGYHSALTGHHYSGSGEFLKHALKIDKDTLNTGLFIKHFRQSLLDVFISVGNFVRANHF